MNNRETLVMFNSVESFLSLFPYEFIPGVCCESVHALEGVTMAVFISLVFTQLPDDGYCR